ncbi:MAG: hypothetical protein KME32_20250 [Mojavia pulchra JT2-VF2]|jgi:hypothetical protein|uniref:Uncharacterized protein n=1 Tax=Mojavia pulchra JT2-VF2 TaxID=287848 RepID=A0A951UHS8_9NOST|nr:hypothetical protein [Mojavia pulchra JT2-VF2]
MSDDTKQSNNFWTTFPGILTGLAAVITAVAGSAGLINAVKPTNPATNPTVETVKTKVLDVYADSMQGTEFTNKQDKSLQIKFKADGKWQAIPEGYTGAGIPEHAKGYISAKGDPDFLSNTTQCSRFPLGALVVKSDGSKCIAYGEEGSFELGPKETVYFLMNDVPNRQLYDDNKGSLKVNLSISND